MNYGTQNYSKKKNNTNYKSGVREFILFINNYCCFRVDDEWVDFHGSFKKLLENRDKYKKLNLINI